MMKKVKTYAKINLSLNVLGKTGGFHDLDTVVVSVDLSDEVTVRPRKDDKLCFTLKGIGEYSIFEEDNNAYKAAKLFKEKFGVSGADITVYKNIPLGGGLGGSSADIAGVLRAMALAFGVDDDLKPLADKLGSDSGYQLYGGLARLKGRGTEVELLDDIEPFWIVLAFPESGVNTADCFKVFDGEKNVALANNEELIIDLYGAKLQNLGKNCLNGLTIAAEKLNGEIKGVLEKVRGLCPLACSMSGSGSTVFAIFDTKELCLWAADKLKSMGINATAVKTVKRYG